MPRLEDKSSDPYKVQNIDKLFLPALTLGFKSPATLRLERVFSWYRTGPRESELFAVSVLYYYQATPLLFAPRRGAGTQGL
jgi:hypothetical protein